jgi:GTP diphosphokinase / guanosine-3',5'-bis(diphosphate) 3'-diphosphatase
MTAGIEIKEDEDRMLIQRAYRNLLKCFAKPLTDEQTKMLRAAYEMAVEAHKEQRRKSGEPYILHPIEVARICVQELEQGPTSAVCALLHDVVEDTSITLDEIRAKFGDKVADIVDGLTKLDSLHESESPQAENFRKVINAMLGDIRVVVIKMADRLHNLRTIKSMKHEKQLKIAAETEFIYAPLAHRLGLYKIKSEFQDIILKITRPEEYYEIAKKLESTLRERESYIKEFSKPIEEALSGLNIKFRFNGRPKSIHSIWTKIQQKQSAFEDIYDLFAVRIIVDVEKLSEKSTCFLAYSVVTDFYMPIPERWKDWISNPKSNGYESLHTTVIGPKARFVEVQIRSERMDAVAERGFAAHWRYKGVKSEVHFEKWLDSVREIIQDSNTSAVEAVNDFQSHLFNEEIHVVTPKGDMIELPVGATALDFGFAIHSDVGAKTVAVIVNGEIVPLGTLLKNGDRVQVRTSSNAKPSEDWLRFVKTGKAKARIRSSLKDDLRKAGEAGKEMVERKMTQLRVDFDVNADFLAKKAGFESRLEFFLALAKEQIQLNSVLKLFKVEAGKLVPILEDKPNLPPMPAVNKTAKPGGALPQIIINGDPGTFYNYQLSSCCNPIKGDPIFAFISSNGAKIHRITCQNATNLMANYAYRIQKAEWGVLAGSDFVVDLIVRGIDSGPGVIERLSRHISSELGLNMRSMSISGDQGHFEARIGIVVGGASQMNMAIYAIKGLDGIASVRRVED